MGQPRKGWKLRKPRPPGQPYYSVRFTNKAGRRVELTTGEGDPREAARVAADLYARDLVSSGSLVRTRVDPLLSLDELMALCLADLLKTHDVETVKQYTRDAKRFAAFFNNTLVNVTHARMADYQRDRMTKVLKKTVQKERAFMNTFFAWAVEQHVIAEADVPSWPKLPKKSTGVRAGPQREKPVDLTIEQVELFLRALPAWSKPRFGKRHAIQARFVVAYETGLRPATLDALVLDRPNTTTWRIGQGFMDIADEDDKARYGRRIEISRLAQLALTLVVRELALKPGDLIFGDHDYREAVEAAARTANLPEDFAVYDLRHARVGHLLDATGDVRAVMAIVGHLLMTTTNKYVRGQRAGVRGVLVAMAGACVGCGHAGSEHGQEGAEGHGEGACRHVDQQADGVVVMCNCPGYRGESGEQLLLTNRAKEGSRTPTSVTPPEPESGAPGDLTSGYGGLAGQERPQKAPAGLGSGDIPETEIPKSVADAARFLAVLQTSDASFEATLAAELLGEGGGL